MILYQGKSLIDGQPIMAIAIKKSGNPKTGDMIQTYIMRSDMDPRDASKLGFDYSICGDCKHRGQATDDPDAKLAKNRSCYVVIGQGPTGVYKAYKNGKYKLANNSDDIAAFAAGRMVRLGTYGDPAAVPSYIWDQLLSQAKGHTAYTHQSNVKTADVRHDLFMTSADSLHDARIAWQNKRRTFRIITMASQKQDNEIICPATPDGGMKSNCSKCGLCQGQHATAPSIAVIAHGNGAKYIQ